MILRLIFGLMFFVFGLNQFFHFIPMEMPAGDAGNFVMALVNAKYFIPMLGVFQTICGLSLLLNRFVPLALIMLIPITLNILLFHIYLAPEGMMMGVLVFLINIFLMYAYRNQYMHFKNSELDHAHQ